MLENKKKNVNNEDSKKKERHIVTWTQEEDDILRDQIGVHGTENWALIASKFKDKTTRQCRRRWYTYLNSDFKKGGWSPEEDMLLCEAQKIFGNRWTEIAKVVSGRTDNAVKNRFSTLCKKRAKYEALTKENKNACINSNDKRILFENGTSENPIAAKKMRRSHILDQAQDYSYGDRSHKQIRPPFAVLAQNVPNTSLAARRHIDNVKHIACHAQDDKNQETFFKKDNTKITALMQQADLLSSLALKVNTENTEESLEIAWKILQDYLNRNKENDNDEIRYKMPEIDFQLEDFKNLVDDLKSTNDGSQLSWRQPDLYESPASSEYSTGSTAMPYPARDSAEQSQPEIDTMLHQSRGPELETVYTSEQNLMDEQEKEIVNTDQVELFQTCDQPTNNDEVVSAFSNGDFSSPLHVTPLFRTLAAGIPSPKFSESERSFLLKTLGIESPAPYPSDNPSQPPPCKRVLLHSL